MPVEKMVETRALSPFTVSIDGDEMAVRKGLAAVLEALNPLDLGVEEEGAVELVLAELLNNVVEHAYPDPTVAGRISIACAHRSDGLHLKITDQGKAMPGGSVPIGRALALDVDVEDLPEGGFGWFLIRDLAKDIAYTRVGIENQLSLRLAVALEAPDRRR